MGVTAPWLASRIVLVAAFSVLVATSACADWTELEDHPCPDEGTALGWGDFARGFLTAYCNDCHGAASSDRRGAPRAVLFDTYEQAHVLRERIFLRSAADNTTMPPGPDDPPIEERAKLAEWIACGAPR